MSVSGRGALVFERSGRSFHTLAEAAGHSSLAPDELARVAAVLGPRASTTIYRDVSWRFDDASRPARPVAIPTTPEAAVVALRDLLDDAVDRMCEGARRVAVLTGGGLDSGGLLAYVARWARRGEGRSFFATAVDFAADGDDRPHLVALARAVACDVVRTTPEAAGPRYRDFDDGVDAAPFMWPTGFFETEAMATARAHGADVVLSGVGGDELLDGQGVFLSHAVARGEIRGAFRAARVLEGFDRPRLATIQWLVRPLVVKRLPRRLRLARLRRGRWPPPAWAGPTLRRVIDEAQETSFARATASLERPAELATRAHRFPIAWLRHQQSIAAGIERRDPFFDLGLLDAIARFPPDYLLLGGRRRGLFRETLAGEVPETFRLRMDKSAFEPATERCLSAAGGFDRLRPHAAARHLAAMGIVEPKPFRRAFELFAAGDDDGTAWALLFPSLAVEAFLSTRDRRAQT